jgi:hypothetical protein
MTKSHEQTFSGYRMGIAGVEAADPLLLRHSIPRSIAPFNFKLDQGLPSVNRIL